MAVNSTGCYSKGSIMALQTSRVVEQQHGLLLSGLQDLYKLKLLTDITLVIGDIHVKCHRNVLAASSSYFKAMFTSELIEQMKEEVELHDMDPVSVKNIVDYMYTAQINITVSNVQGVFTVASMFNMLELCELCANYIKNELDVTNCVGVYQFGSFHNCQSLKTSGKEYVVNHFHDIANSDELMSLQYDDFKEIIREDRLNVRSEDVVFRTIQKWVEYSLEKRAGFFPELFSHLRLPLLSQQCLDEIVMTNEIIMTDESSKELMSMAKIYKEALANGESEESIKQLNVNARKRLGMFNKKMMVFVGGAQEKNNRALTCYDPRTKKNYCAIPLHVSFDFKYRIDYHRAVSTERSEVFLIGGIFYEDHHFEETGPSLAEVKLYDPYKLKWQNKASLKTPRCAHVVLYVKGHIYAIGGKSTYPRGLVLDSVECYDREKDEWRYVASLPEGRCHHAGVVHRDIIYVIGGTDPNEQVTNSFFQYDVTENIWSVLEWHMQVARAECGATVVNDQIFVIGGTDGFVKLSSVESFSFVSKRWTHATDFPEDRKSMVTVTFDDCIYVCGGVRTLISRQNRAPRLVETKDLWKYDPLTGFWTREAKLVQYANVHACTVAEMNVKLLHESEFISSS